MKKVEEDRKRDRNEFKSLILDLQHKSGIGLVTEDHDLYLQDLVQLPFPVEIDPSTSMVKVHSHLHLLLLLLISARNLFVV